MDEGIAAHVPTPAFSEGAWTFDGYSIHHVGADPGGEAFLLVADDGSTALFDTGFAFCAPRTLENIYAVTGGRPVQKIVLTHSHYDHCAATPYLLDHMPDAKVYASAHAARVFSRSGAYVTMSALNAERAFSKNAESGGDIREIRVDVVLGDGDEFSVGPLRFSAIEAVGHTKCCLAFWCASEGLLVSSETSGVVCPVMPKSVDVPSDVPYMVDLAALVGYTSMLEHVERVRKLPIRVLLATHYGCILHEDVDGFWRSFDFWDSYLEGMVLDMHKQGCSDEEIAAEYKKRIYWDALAPYQPEAAFDINISYVVPTMIRDCLGEGDA